MLYKPSPGVVSGNEIEAYEDINPDDIVSRVIADMAALNLHFEQIDKYDVCPVGTYKVALVIALNQDYHWYRQDNNHFWSHKRGSTNVINYDASDQLIIDPEIANRDYTDEESCNYSIFVGYFAVEEWGYLYDPD